MGCDKRSIFRSIRQPQALPGAKKPVLSEVEGLALNWLCFGFIWHKIGFNWL